MKLALHWSTLVFFFIEKLSCFDKYSQFWLGYVGFSGFEILFRFGLLGRGLKFFSGLGQSKSHLGSVRVFAGTRHIAIHLVENIGIIIIYISLKKFNLTKKILCTELTFCL